VTLVLAALGRETIWLLTDRRLSVGERPLKDDARKTTVVTAKDGIAMIGYAGLGQTGGGTEPADWICSVLRNRKQTVEGALGVVSAAMQRQFPPHLKDLP
jgi:hypothetical protein